MAKVEGSNPFIRFQTQELVLVFVHMSAVTE